MTATNLHLSIITLNVNGLNAPIKRRRVTEWIRKQDPSICCLQETHLRNKDVNLLKVKGWKKIYQANNYQKRAGVAILISDKIDFKTKSTIKDKEGHYIMIKGTIHHEDITIINIYAPNDRAPKYIKQTLTALKREIDSSTIIVGDFNTPLSVKDRTTKKKLSKDTEDLKGTISQLDLIDIYRTLHPTAAKYTFFSNAHGTFSRIDHILGHRAILNKIQNIEIIHSIFSDHNAIKVEINNRKSKEKNQLHGN